MIFEQDILFDAFKSRSETSCISSLFQVTNCALHIINDRIHNSHMLASAWKKIRDQLELLSRAGLRDQRVVFQVRDNQALRKEYLFLYDFTTKLANVLQTRFSQIARTSGTPLPYKYTDNLVQSAV